MLTTAEKPLETKNSVEMGEVGSTFLLLKDCSLAKQNVIKNTGGREVGTVAQSGK